MFSPLPFVLLILASSLVLQSRVLYWAPSNVIGLLQAASLGDLAGGVVLTLIGLALHELGHAAAALRSGRRAQELGVTLAYRFVPALYLQLGPAPAAATRWERLSTEIAGSSVQLMYAAALVAVSTYAPSFTAVIGAVLTLLLALWQLLPLPGQDGAHALRALRH